MAIAVLAWENTTRVLSNPGPSGILLLLVLVLVLVLFVFIRISGRHRVAHDHEGTPVDQPGGKFLGDVWGHAVAPLGWTRGAFTPSAVIRHANLTPFPGPPLNRPYYFHPGP